jgi:hypothetical protein
MRLTSSLSPLTGSAGAPGPAPASAVTTAAQQMRPATTAEIL